MKNYIKIIVSILIVSSSMTTINYLIEILLNKSSESWKGLLLIPAILLVFIVVYVIIKEIWKSSSSSDKWINIEDQEPPLNSEVLFIDIDDDRQPPDFMKHILEGKNISNIGHGLYTGNKKFVTYHLLGSNGLPQKDIATHWRYLPDPPKK